MSRSELDWLPERGAHLDSDELATILEALHALVDGTNDNEPNRAHIVTAAFVLTRAIDRTAGGEQ